MLMLLKYSEFCAYCRCSYNYSVLLLFTCLNFRAMFLFIWRFVYSCCSVASCAIVSVYDEYLPYRQLWYICFQTIHLFSSVCCDSC